MGLSGWTGTTKEVSIAHSLRQKKPPYLFSIVGFLFCSEHIPLKVPNVELYFDV